MFGKPEMPPAQQVAAPPPANPPQFGANSKEAKRKAPQGYQTLLASGGADLGGATTSNKTLLGA